MNHVAWAALCLELLRPLAGYIVTERQSAPQDPDTIHVNATPSGFQLAEFLRSLSTSSPCGPTSDELVKHVGFTRSFSKHGYSYRPKPYIKFYLHDAGAFNFTDIVECYFAALGSDDRLDEETSPKNAEHSVDVLLLRQLQGHAMRTFDPMEAAIHVVGAPLHTARLAFTLGGSPCGAETDFFKRRQAATSALQELPVWKNHPEKLVFIDSDMRVGKVLGETLTGMLVNGSGTLASADHEIAARYAGTWKSVVIPYRAHTLLDAFATRSLEYDGRSVAFFFHGNAHVFRAEARREVLEEIMAGLPDSSFRDVNFKNYTVHQFARISSRTVASMRKSKFCFVPAGDTPSSRRLFDALAAGCVPIILGNFQIMARNLPFTNTIKWGDIALFGGSPSCLGEHIPATTLWLNSLLAPTEEQTTAVREMRRRGRLAFVRHLSYHALRGGMATAFLREFNADGSVKGEMSTAA